MLPLKNVSMANVMAHPRGSLMPPTRCFPLKGTWMSLPPCNECPSCVFNPILARQRALESSREHVASEKHVNGQRRASPQGGSPMPPVRRCPSKGTRMSLPHMQWVPSLLNRPCPSYLDSTRSPRVSLLPKKRVDASSPCLYRSYEGFTHCSRVLVRSHL